MAAVRAHRSRLSRTEGESPSSRQGIGAVVFLAALVLAGCLGGGGNSVPAVPVASGLQPTVDGFSFPNFASESYDADFSTVDVVDMFGSGPAVCVDGVAEPCTLTAEAAAFARMVNQARATGHCEGLVTVALTRFNEKQSPQTVALPDEGETIKAIMRAFATQFIPEVQTEIQSWLAASFKDKLAAMSKAFAEGRLEYTLGVYTPEGGHAVLPYAIEYPAENVARVMVYDSNWPAKNRWVDIDLKANKWFFSFSGEDPANDPDVWTGGPNFMDLTSIDTRQGTCPFCGDGTSVVKNTLLVRTENLDWSVEVNGTTVSPSDPTAAAGDGVVVKPVKGSVSRPGGRSAFDYVIEIPTSLMGGSSTTTTSIAPGESRSKLTFSGTTSLFALTPGGIAQVKTSGNPNVPVEVGNTSIVSNDPGVSLTLASGNLVASASGPQASLSVTGETMAVTVQTASGQVVEQAVTPDAPAAQIVADATGGVTSLVQSSSGEVVKTAVSSDGTATKTVEAPGSLNLSSTTFEPPKGLESKPIESLPPPSARNLANPDYKPDTAYVAPTTTVEGGKVSPQAVVPVRPVLGRFEIAARTFGDAPFVIAAPTSTSEGAFTFTSSDTSVIEVSTTGRATVVGAGTATITAAQEGTTRHLPALSTAQIRVAKARPVVGTVAAVTRRFGDAAFTVAAPTSTSSAEFTWESSDQRVVRVAPATGRVTIVGVGTATLTASQQATNNYEAGERKVTVTVSRRVNTLEPITAVAVLSKRFGDAPFTIPAPASVSTGAFTWSSSNDQVISVEATTGVARIIAVGSATVRVTQAATTTDESGSTSATITVSRAETAMEALELPAVDMTSEAVRLTAPTSTSKASVSWTSSNTSVATVNASTGVVTPVAPGTTTITARQEESTTHTAASVSATLTVSRAATVMGALDLPELDTVSEAVRLTAPTSTSKAAVSWTSSNTSVATVNSSTGLVTPLLPGTTTITARQEQSTTHTAASVSATLTVARGTPSLGALSAPTKTFGDAPFAMLAPESPSTGAFTWDSNNSDVATIDSQTGVVSIVGAGQAVIIASQAATTRYSPSSATVVLTVAKATQSPLIITTTDGTVGEGLVLAASGGSGTGAVTFTRVSAGTAGCTLAESTLSASSAGSCTVSASKAADTNYLIASSATTTITFIAVVQQTECTTTYSLDGAYAVERITTVGSCGWTAPIGVTEVSYLVVAGGGGGASGGGGGGGVLTNHGGSALTVVPGAQYSVTVGAGGTAGRGSTRAASGGNSVFGSVTAIGGGGGGGNSSSAPRNGGSGGGGGFDQPTLTRTTGTAGQGFGGGRSGVTGGYSAGGGGGGAGGAGADAVVKHLGGAGGVGLQSTITGTATYYGGGGGGGVNQNCGGCSVTNGGGAGGLGGGGNGSNLGVEGGSAGFNGTAGTNGLGGGGGGTDPESSVAGAGGSGVVIIRYLAPTVFGRANEPSTLSVAAPAGHVFAGVIFASYGTPTGADGSYATSGCHSATSVQKTAEAILGQASALLPATNGVYGDPCPGTGKWLVVVLTVKPSAS